MTQYLPCTVSDPYNVEIKLTMNDVLLMVERLAHKYGHIGLSKRVMANTMVRMVARGVPVATPTKMGASEVSIRAAALRQLERSARNNALDAVWRGMTRTGISPEAARAEIQRMLGPAAIAAARR